MSDADNRIWFNDLQFDLQLKLEECATDDALRDFGRTLKAHADAERFPPADRRDLAIRVLLALRDISGIDPKTRFTVWCDGFGISSEECFDAVANMLRAHRAQTGKGQADEDR